MWICFLSPSLSSIYKILKHWKKIGGKRERLHGKMGKKKVWPCAGSSRGNCRHGYILPAAALRFPESDECKTGAARERETDRWSGSYCSERLRIEMLYYRQRHVWPLTQQHTEIKDRMKPLRIEFNFLNALNFVLVLHLAVYFSYVNSCIKNISSQFSTDIVAHSSKEACISGVWVFICIQQQRSLTPQSQRQTEF